jgi:hypothetical protein
MSRDAVTESALTCLGKGTRSSPSGEVPAKPAEGFG